MIISLLPFKGGKAGKHLNNINLAILWFRVVLIYRTITDDISIIMPYNFVQRGKEALENEG